MLEGRRRGFPSPCSSPPWNCLELTQPIGRPGDPGEGPHSTKPRRRFQETFSQYASRIWAAHQHGSGTLIAGRIGARNLPPPQIRTGIPQHQLPSVQQLPNRRQGSGSGGTNCNWRKGKKRGSFSPVLRRKQRLGWGRIGVGEPRGGIKIEPCRRKSRGVGPREISLFALCSQ